jgi:hypothetical protein
VAVVVHPEARAILEDYTSKGSTLTEARLRMARVPEGADLIPNRYSGAPGIRWGNIYIMAGVPMITAGMLDALTGSLEGGAPVLSATLGCWVEAMSQTCWPARKKPSRRADRQLSLLSRGQTGANFVIRSVDADTLAACTAQLAEALTAMGRPPVEGGI